MSINALMDERFERTGDAPLLERRTNAGDTWEVVSANAFRAEVLAVAAGLMARGVNTDDRIAILSRTRYEWTLLDFALWSIGAVGVPVYETSSTSQIQWILSDSGATTAIVETAHHASLVEEARTELPLLHATWIIEDGLVEALKTDGVDIPEQDVITRRNAVHGSDLATIIYTSGSTGRPKGAELTHFNFAYVAQNAALAIPDMFLAEGARTILFLPLAHVLARVIQTTVLASNTVLGHVPNVKTLVADMQSFRPTFLLAVPRVFEKVYNTAEAKASTSKIRRSLFYWAVRSTIAYSRDLDLPRVPFPARVRHGIANRLVLSKLRDAMGGNVTMAISGGAPLGERLGHFYRGMGVLVLDGYGLTETTAPAAVCMPETFAVASVGPAIPGTTIRLADDGEVLVNGPHVFRGYHNDPVRTQEVLQDGWFHTGDIGSIDDEGRLTITGRKKEIIVTAGGKNVAPAILEDRLRSHPLISQVVVVGDAQPFIGALVTLDPDMLPGWLATKGLPEMSVEEARENPQVLASLQRAVDRANRVMARAESIRKFTVLPIDFTEANGYLTPSLKVKKLEVKRDFAAEIAELYGTTTSVTAPSGAVTA
ncbi:MAG: AMP-binding protein [Cellulomonadaceae bacterium]|jgi:long-chain acyl-CoA synthetase|nr:AMP-binding protein [Cellulomonadaceae bacterium]